jgi:hypothetical protein
MGETELVSCPCKHFEILYQLELRIFSPGFHMKNPLDSILGTIISGLILTFVLYVFVRNFIVAGV